MGVAVHAMVWLWLVIIGFVVIRSGIFLLTMVALAALHIFEKPAAPPMSPTLITTPDLPNDDEPHPRTPAPPRQLDTAA